MTVSELKTVLSGVPDDTKLCLTMRARMPNGTVVLDTRTIGYASYDRKAYIHLQFEQVNDGITTPTPEAT